MTIAERMRNHRWLKPFIQLLRQGVSPEKIALSIALGVVLGVTPVLGSTITLCTLAAVALRLNLPAIQLVNGLVYPLQLILLIPFYRAGAWIFGAGSSALSFHGIRTMIRLGAWTTIRTLWVVTLHALVAWLAFGAATTAILYAVLLPSLRRVWKKTEIEHLADVIPAPIDP